MWKNQQGNYVLFKRDVTTGVLRFSIVSGALPCRDPDVMVMWRNQQGKYVLFKRDVTTGIMRFSIMSRALSCRPRCDCHVVDFFVFEGVNWEELKNLRPAKS